MKKLKILLLVVTHACMGLAGFTVGIYVLPILVAPAAPEVSDIRALAQQAVYQGTFRRDLEDSDMLHWGDGEVFVGDKSVALLGKLAPGPDYHLYLSPGFVETEADFLRLKSGMAHIGEVRTFENFIVPVPAAIDAGKFNTVIVWSETFGQFITSARYR